MCFTDNGVLKMDIEERLRDLLKKLQIDEAIKLVASVKGTDDYTVDIARIEKNIILLIKLRDLLNEWQIDKAIRLIARIKETTDYTPEVQIIEKGIGLLKEARKNLVRGRAIATGVGAFAVIAYESELGRQVLLRRRKEKDSIIYEKDLSGKWELIGGGVDISDFVSGQDGYLGSVTAAIRREAKEEAELDLSSWQFDGLAYKAMLAKSDEKQSLFDDAFSILIPWQLEFETSEFDSLIRKGELRFVPIEAIPEIEIISPRMRFLIKQALVGWENQCKCHVK
jgi:8-oxo-dGTP pyrophosphatase MutT (NUDIX family)